MYYDTIKVIKRIDGCLTCLVLVLPLHDVFHVLPGVVKEEDPGNVASVGAELVAGELALVGRLDHHKVGGQLLDLLR